MKQDYFIYLKHDESEISLSNIDNKKCIYIYELENVS